MSSITIEVTGATAERLRHLAMQEHRSESEIVRDALEAYEFLETSRGPWREIASKTAKIARDARVPDAQVKRKLPTGAGKYHSGQRDLAQRDEEILTEAVREGRWP